MCQYVELVMSGLVSRKLLFVLNDPFKGDAEEDRLMVLSLQGNWQAPKKVFLHRKRVSSFTFCRVTWRWRQTCIGIEACQALQRAMV